MKARACYRDKNIGMGPLKAKCRVVLKGFNDPDLAGLARNSPTATRLSFFMLIAVSTSFEWGIGAADATAAFL